MSGGARQKENKLVGPRVCFLCHAEIPAGTPLAWPDKATATDAVWDKERCEFRHGTDEGCGRATNFRTAAEVMAEKPVAQTTLPEASPSAPPAPPAVPVTVPALQAEQVAILRAAGRFPQDASQQEIQFGLMLAAKYDLDVWSGQVKFIRFRAGEKLTPYLGIEAFRALAERSGVYDGREIAVERDKDGHPIRATCTVYRTDRTRPLVEEVEFSEACRYSAAGKPTYAWETMPVTMLRKAAEERALRAAFPLQLSGLYGDAEVPEQ